MPPDRGDPRLRPTVGFNSLGSREHLCCRAAVCARLDFTLFRLFVYHLFIPSSFESLDSDPTTLRSTCITRSVHIFCFVFSRLFPLPLFKSL